MKKFLLSALSLVFACLAGCGGGGGAAGTAPAATQSVQPTTQANVVQVVVDAGISHNINLPFVSVTVCAPGSATACQTIDHVLLDTGSSGLRVYASALSSLSLPRKQTAAGASIAECTHFADGYAWGALSLADVSVGGEQAHGLTLQVVDDTLAVPEACSDTGNNLATAAEFGANGVLGVGLFVQDCGSACSSNADNGLYYGCISKGCAPLALALADQVSNPVASFASDNNGVVIAMNAVGDGGAVTAGGTLTFGIGTQANNGIGTASLLPAQPLTGYVTTSYNGRSYGASLFDTGSNAIFFQDAAIPVCASGFYCPAQPLSLSAQPAGAGAIAFTVENADQLFARTPTEAAFGTLAGTAADAQTFAWGLPFFYGRKVYLLLEGAQTARGNGPAVAY